MNRFIKPIIFLSIVLCPLINFAAQEEKVEQEEEKVAQEVVPVTGQLKVITKDLEQAARSFNNKSIRGLISKLGANMEKITPEQDTAHTLATLDKVAQVLNKIKDPKLINPKELAVVENILAKIETLKNSYPKNIDLSHLKKPNEKFDLFEIETYSQEPFMDLILAQQETKLPYILARVADGPKASYFDAHLLNTYIFNGYPIYPNAGKWELDGQKMRHKKEGFGFRQTINPLNRKPLNINNVDYYTLNSLKDTEFKYLASLNDLINKQDVQNFFYKKNSPGTTLEPFKELESFSTNSIAISSNNKFIVTSGRGAKIWDAQTGNKIHELAVAGDKYFTQVAISPNNQFVVTGYLLTPPSTIGAQIWDAQTGAVLHSLTHEGSVGAVAISSDNKFVVTKSSDRTAKIWNLQTGALIHRLDGDILSVAISPNNQFVITGGSDSTKIWNAQTGAMLHELKHHDEDAFKLAISPDNKFVLVATSGGAQIWNLQTGAFMRNLTPKEHIRAIAISSNNQFFVTVSVLTAKIWNAQTGALLHTLKHTDCVNRVAISPNNKFVITGSSDKTAKIWNIQTGALLYTLKESQHAISAVAISPNNKFVVTGSTGATKIWEIPE